MADDRDLAKAITDAAADIVGAGERTAAAVRDLDGSVRAMDVRLSRSLDDLRLEQGALAGEVRAATTRRAITPVQVAPVPSRWRVRLFAGLAGALAMLLFVALGVLIWRACNMTRPIGLAGFDDADEMDSRRRPPPRRPRADGGVEYPREDPNHDRRAPQRPGAFYRVECTGAPNEPAECQTTHEGEAVERDPILLQR